MKVFTRYKRKHKPAWKKKSDAAATGADAEGAVGSKVDLDAEDEDEVRRYLILLIKC